jgi:GDP-4-dehydro-6-deoxy-D-mannose reductase
VAARRRERACEGEAAAAVAASFRFDVAEGKFLMRVLITGITGFVGSHLVEYLLAEHPDIEISGTYRWRSRTENIEHLRAHLRLHETDLRDAAAVRRTLALVRPDVIFHLAAQSYVPASWTAPSETLTTNVSAQTHLFEAVRDLQLDPVIQIACSSEEYGLVLPDEVPIRETNPLRPLSPYAVSKVAQDYLAYQYFQTYGIKVVRTRGFNHTGPRRGDVFVTSNFAKQIATIEAGRAEPVLRVGNLEALRDFTDVRDMVRAYWLAVVHCKPGEVYNIATGEGIRIRDVLDRLLALAGRDIRIEVDPARLRPSDVEVLIGDSSKFRAETGWEPRIPFEKTLKDILDYWRSRLGVAGR